MRLRRHCHLLVAGLLAFLSAVAAGTTAAHAASTATAAAAPYVVVLRDSADVDSTAAQYQRSFGAVVTARFSSALKGFAAQLSSSAVARLASDSRALFVEPDVTAVAAAETVPTGVARIQAQMDNQMDEPLVSAQTSGGQPVNVAILDTGIDATHPDLSVAASGVNCTNDRLAAYVDPAGHGTLVAGVVGARRDGSGIVGVAPDPTTLWSVRVLKKNGEGSISSIICGIDWATATHLDSDTGNDIAVANMSLVAKGSDDNACGMQNKDALHLAICRSVDAGVTYVAAAGNAGADLGNYVPAAYDEVLAATAMTDLDGKPGGLASSNGTCVPAKETSRVADDSATYFSNYASPADAGHTIAAPGVCITSTRAGGGYAVATGTSFAAPHVSGVVASVWASCMASGPCASLKPSDVSATVRNDVINAAAEFNVAYSLPGLGFGFAGDPLHPLDPPQPNKTFGYLVRAGG
jgi:subtilisin